ncbi:MAG: hypothetical protein PHI34_06610 [Acidobacteriota bacterium]|nr:hypothetical protein [Acidobacteriota bacterium]
MEQRTKPKPNIPKWSRWLAAVCLAAAAFAVLKNIAYPLLWNDEGETAMFAERVLDYGYPKVSDGKNVVYYLELKDKMAGRRTPDGAYLGSGWGHFYWGTIGALAARAADGVAGARGADLYLKTALLRLPFALAGLAAILLAIIAVAPLLMGGNSGGAGGSPARIWLFAAAVFAWQSLSVSWALHMREMRYYALVCLLLSWLLYLTVRRHTGRMRAGRYAVLTTAALVLLLVTFPPAMAGAAGALGLTEVVLFVRKRDIRKALAGIVPLAAAGAAGIVYAGVFRSLRIAAGFAELFPRTPARTREAVVKIFAFFRDYESLWVIAAALGLGSVVAGVSWIRARRGGRLAPGTAREHGGLLLMSRADRGLVGLSVLVAVYILIHAAVFIMASFPFPFERYFIWLQPAAGLVLWLNLFALGGTLKTLPDKWARRGARAALAGGFILLATLTAGERVPVLRARVYELFHRYIGPVDYVVGFIRRQYPDTSRLVVATNYEEGVLQYYLGSRVIIGFVGNNLKEDMKLTPDVIVGRKRSAYTNRNILELMERARYKQKTIWIHDTIINNIPEVMPGFNSHRYRTERTDNERWALKILYK